MFNVVRFRNNKELFEALRFIKNRLMRVLDIYASLRKCFVFRLYIFIELNPVAYS